MKNLILIALGLFLSFNMQAQVYEGFERGMTKDEAKDEFKSNKDKYTAVDLGNGWVWRLYHQNFKYDDKGLTSVHFTPKGGALGVSYDNTVGYLEQTRLFFEKLGYETYLEQPYWNAPHTFKGTYGLLMTDPEEKRVIQLFPVKASNVMLPNMVVHDYEWFMSAMEEKNDNLEEKAKDTGF